MRGYRTRIRQRNISMYATFKATLKESASPNTAFIKAANQGMVKLYHAKRIIRAMVFAEMEQLMARGERPEAAAEKFAQSMGGKVSPQLMKAIMPEVMESPKPGSATPADSRKMTLQEIEDMPQSEFNMFSKATRDKILSEAASGKDRTLTVVKRDGGRTLKIVEFEAEAEEAEYKRSQEIRAAQEKREAEARAEAERILKEEEAAGIIGLSAEAKRLTAAIKNRVPALCIGETGTGKTSVVKHVSQKLGRSLVRVNLDGGVTPDEIIGRYQAKAEDGVTVTYFQEGVVPRAMRSGSVLLLDELNAALPDTLFCLHSLLEDKPTLFIPETQEEIIPAEGFAVVATMNPSHEYAGTKGLNAALYSRFGMVLRFDALRGDALQRAILTHVPALKGSASINRICGIIEVADRLRKKEQINTRLTLREGIAAAKMIAAGDLTEEEAVEGALHSKLEHHEKQAVVNGGGR